MKANKGFTLIEIVAVFTIMIIIISTSTLSISSTLKKNTVKANTIKSQNILKATEDYIIKNKLRVTASAPLYFSVEGLVAENILTDDATKTLEEYLSAEAETKVEGPFIIKATKLANDIDFEFVPVVEVLGSNAAINFNEALTDTWALEIEDDGNLIIREQQNKTIKFRLAEINDHNAIKNLHIKKAELVIKKLVNGTFTNFSVRTINDLKVTNDGRYYFTFKNNLAPSTNLYRFNIRVTTETGAVLTAEDDVNLPILTGISKPLYTYATSASNWLKTNASVVVYGQQYGTSKKADEITYSGKRYTTGIIGGAYVNVPLTTVTPNVTTHEATITLSQEGIYVLDFNSKIIADNLSSAMPTTVTVKIDKTVPSCAVAGGSTAWYNTNRTITGACSDTNGSGCTGNVSITYNTDTNGSYSPGTIYDLANNSTTCAVQTVKIDKTAPTCTSTGGSTTWYNINRTITGTCSDSGSGCTGNVSQTYSTDTNTNYSPGTVTDAVGNSTVCAVQTVKIDKTAPTCTSSGGSTTWYNTNRTITGTCSDSGSGCTGNASVTYSANMDASYSPGTVYDAMGYSATCAAQTVRIDKTLQTISMSKCNSTANGEGSVAAMCWGRAIVNTGGSPTDVTCQYYYPGTSMPGWSQPTYLYPYIYSTDTGNSRIINGNTNDDRQVFMIFLGFESVRKVGMKCKVTDAAGTSSWYQSDSGGDGYWDCSTTSGGVSC